MRDEDKPFICYKQGWSMRIVPRNATGWRAFIAWMLSLGLITATFAFVVSLDLSDAAAGASVAVYALILVVWSIAMIRWMKARAEIIDMAELLKLKREQERSKRRGH